MRFFSFFLFCLAFASYACADAADRPPDVSAILKKLSPSLVTVHCATTVGTTKDNKTVVGVIVDPKGIVIAPVENLRGKVLGLLSKPEPQGHGFAIPSNRLNEMMSKLADAKK